MNRLPQSTLSAVLLATLAFSPACSKKLETPAGEALISPAPASAYKTLADAPEAERSAMDTFAKQLEKAIQEGEPAGVKAMFNLGGIADKILHGVQGTGPDVGKFREGLRQGLTQNLDFVIKMWANQDVTYKHLVIHEGQLKPRFRLASDTTGITLLDFTVEKNTAGQLAVVDFYNHALGSGMVTQTRQASLPALVELDKSFLQRLLDKPSTAVKDIENFGKMAGKFRQQDFKGVIEIYRALNPELQKNLSANAMYLSALQQSNDDEGYKKALKEAATVFKSANFQFMLVDLHFMEKDYDKAIECLDAFMSAVEKDAALLTYKALLQMTKGDIPAATATIHDALALEPSSVYVHSLALDVFLTAKDFEAAAKSMTFLESTGKYSFKNSMTDPLWEEFIKSPASTPWR